jgi:hypothetical protein
LRANAIVRAEEERPRVAVIGRGAADQDKGVLMMRILTLMAALGWSVVAMAGSVVAMKPATSFGYLDTDKDARVSPAEAKADWVVAQGFDAADTNKDGYLDKGEFAALGRS